MRTPREFWEPACAFIADNGSKARDCDVESDTSLWGAASKKSSEGAEQRQEAASSVLTAVGDAKSNEELVYAVGVNQVEGITLNDLYI